MIEYTVKVYDKNEDKFAGTHWYLNGNRHRVDGPAIEYANGDKRWYLNNRGYLKVDWKLEVAKLNKQSDPCDGKEVLIDGKKYKLTAV